MRDVDAFGVPVPFAKMGGRDKGSVSGLDDRKILRIQRKSGLGRRCRVVQAVPAEDFTLCDIFRAISKALIDRHGKPGVINCLNPAVDPIATAGREIQAEKADR